MEKLFKKKTSNTEEFINKSKNIHKGKYEYSKVKYVRCDIKVCIICPIHGEFWVTPNNHLRGKGCPKCSGKGLTHDEIIERFNIIHDNKYTYEKFIYTKAKEKSIITCPEHGDFNITPNHHLSGEGCPICKHSKLESELISLFKENGIDFTYDKILPKLGKQRPDFYLEKYNLIIECQGIQHFKYREYYFGKKNIEQSFNKTIENDTIKYLNCVENGIDIIYYTYKRNIANVDLNDKKFNGIYNNGRLFLKKEKLLEYILAKIPKI